jgi:hypothetical protein
MRKAGNGRDGWLQIRRVSRKCWKRLECVCACAWRSAGEGNAVWGVVGEGGEMMLLDSDML